MKHSKLPGALRPALAHLPGARGCLHSITPNRRSSPQVLVPQPDVVGISPDALLGDGPDDERLIRFDYFWSSHSILEILFFFEFNEKFRHWLVVLPVTEPYLSEKASSRFPVRLVKLVEHSIGERGERIVHLQ